MAAHVIAYLYRDFGGTLKIKVGIITCDCMNVAQGQASAGRDSL